MSSNNYDNYAVTAPADVLGQTDPAGQSSTMKVIDDAATTDSPTVSPSLAPSATLKLTNLLPKLNPKTFSKILSANQIPLTGVKVTKQFNQSWAKIRFPSVEAKLAALAILRSTNLNGQVTSHDEPIGIVEVGGGGCRDNSNSAAVAPPSAKRRKTTDGDPQDQEEPNGDEQEEQQGSNNNSNRGGKQTAEEAVCPWFDVPYEVQLQRKRADMEQVILDMTMRMKKEMHGAPYPRWLRRVLDNARAQQQQQQQSTLAAATTAAAVDNMDMEPQPPQPPQPRQPRSRPLACPLDDIVPSPEQSGYRNKTELTIGVNHAGEVTAGFMLTAARHAAGVSLVGEPTENCKSVSTQHRAIHQDIVVPLLRQAAQHFPYASAWNRLTHHGLWRLAIIRTTRTGDAMLVLQINPRNVTAPSTVSAASSGSEQHQQPEQEQEQEKERELELKRLEQFVVQFVQHTCDPDRHRIVSLYMQHHIGVSDAAPLDAPQRLLWGLPCITETVLDLQFQISPTSFFQVNTRATELLYSQACAWAMPELASSSSSSSVESAVAAGSTINTPPATVLDVCCGTGTIGLCVASLAASGGATTAVDGTSTPTAVNVIGVEIVPDAVRDAGRNAEQNRVANIAFIAGKAEDVLKGVLSSRGGGGGSGDHNTSRLVTGPGITTVPADGGQVVAIVDPPRAGLHKKVIQALRDCSRINRLVYISCNQKALVQDVVGLCRPESNTYRGREFVPVRAVAFDLFPHTPHCELAMLFERDQPLSSPSAPSSSASSSSPAPAPAAPSL